MKIKLTYFDFKGLGEAIRLSLYVSNIPFEDDRISYAEVSKRRSSLPYGQVPVLEVDGNIYGQSNAILRWSGRQGQLYPDALQLQCDGVLGCMEDINKSLSPLWYGHVLGRCPGTGEKLVQLTEEQQEATVKHLNEDVLPGYFSMLERQLGSNQYFCGSALTIADLKWYVVGLGFIDGSYAEGISKKVLDGFPTLVNLVDRVGSHPRVEQWNLLK